MDRKSVFTFITIFSFVVGMGYFLSGETPVEESVVAEKTAPYIVQGQSMEAVANAVRSVGGEITHEIGIINAVGAVISSEQLNELAKDSSLRIQADGKADVAGPGPSTFYSTMTERMATSNGVDS